MDFLAFDRVQRNEAVFDCYIHNHPHHIHLLLLTFLRQMLTMIEMLLNILRRDIFNKHFAKRRIEISVKLL